MSYQSKELYDEIKEKAFDYGITKPSIPDYIKNNLRYDFFDWQERAFINFLTYQAIKEEDKPNKPTHLMFNMATGSGKTMLMASAILYYYKQGYCHFLFFVNQNNIVDKTENNFIDSSHTKYLFQEKIVIDDKTIPIKKVETFSDNPEGIEIKFTTIQKLYNDIHIERENQTTLDSLHNLDLIMLADEGHHLNTLTKNSRGTQQEDLIETELTDRTSKVEVERKGWEHTVIELLLNKNNGFRNNNNVLLEFTATVPEIKEVAEKYQDKTIIKFGLKEFLSAGYTKEINLISSTLTKKERIIQALLFNWYRHKIAIKNGIPNFKPVILFRSKLIEESNNDYEEFLNLTNTITTDDFKFLTSLTEKISQSNSLYEQGKSRTEQVIKFIKQENITYSEIAEYIKSCFQERNTIITNSKTNTAKTKEKTSEEQEALLNSLEDKNNHIRAIFTVERLTEGWDVLNLYDIVRLYQGQNTGGRTKKSKQVPEATTREKQLIGRGVRYYPFQYKDIIPNKRKFDEDLNNELRILEELFYYTYDEESRYISHLKEELKKDGYIQDDKIIKTFDLKNNFKNSDFYKQAYLWYNKQEQNPSRRKNTLQDLQESFNFQYKIKGLEFKEEEIVFDNQKDIERLSIEKKAYQTIVVKFSQIEKHIFRKAINIKSKQDNSLLRFDILHKELEIASIDDLQSDNYLGEFLLKIIVDEGINYEEIDNTEKLNMTMKFLDEFSFEFKKTINPYIGGEFISDKISNVFKEPKIKTVQEDNESERLFQSLKNENWYVLDDFIGTDQEIALIEFIQQSIGNLKSSFNEVYLLRNEEVYKIFDFKKGRGFQPDFLLLLKGDNDLYLQVFIEPKQEKYMTAESEIWKENFLQEITNRYGNNKLLVAENDRYKLFGLPFYNTNVQNKFEEVFFTIAEG